MRLVQLTDLHLRQHQPGASAINTRRSRQMAELFAEALRRIRGEGCDLLALTGDLLDMPAWLLEDTYGFATDDPALWLEAAERDYRLLKRLLDDSGLRYVVLPGNHDRPDLLWRVFDAVENIFDVGGHRIVRFCDREYAGHFPRRFHDQRRRFDAVLADASSPPQIHLQHYLLTPRLNEGYPHTYVEAEELVRRILASGRVRLCLSGHYHVGTPLLDFGTTKFAACPSFAEAPHAWLSYEIDGEGVRMQRFALEHQPEHRPAMRPVVFLDRDGVINDLASYSYGPERMNLLPGVAAAVARLRAAGYAVVIVTGQSAIGMGYVTEMVVISVHDRMCRLLVEQGGEGANPDGIYYSAATTLNPVLPQYADTSECKPAPAMLHQAARELNLDLSRAWLVGDRALDIEMARNGQVRPILVRSGDGRLTEAEGDPVLRGVLVADDLRAAAAMILKEAGG